MAVLHSSASTVVLPRLIAALLVIVAVATAVSFAASGGPSATVILPASVVLGMGLYYGGTTRYDVTNEGIRIVGVLGERKLTFDKVSGFDQGPPESFGARWLAVLSGASRSYAIGVEADGGFLSGPTYLWVRDREAFLSAARDALGAWNTGRAVAA